MQITNFDKIRVGQTFPSCFDIQKIEEHESDGIFAIARITNPSTHRVELRKKVGDVALFTFMELPEYWKDSELLWTNQV